MTREETLNLTGRELDTAIAQHVFGREVLGEALCAPWHDGDGWRVVAGQHGGELRPVIVEHCCCDLEEDEHQGGQEVPILGHTWHCLEPVPRFSEEPEPALEVIARLHAFGWSVSLDLFADGHNQVRLRGPHPPYEVMVGNPLPWPVLLGQAALAVVLGTEEGVA